MQKLRKQTAFTLLELMVAVIILGVLASYGMPRFQKVFEQSRVDLSTANLESIWTAQRLYKAQHGAFAPEISDLSNFLDASFLNTPCIAAAPCDAKCDFCYFIDSSDAISFTAKALRNSNKTTSWTGYIVINDSGTLSGYTQNGSAQIRPAQF